MPAPSPPPPPSPLAPAEAAFQLQFQFPCVPALLLLLLLVSSARASWTVMVYLEADNDLEAFSLQDIQEMATVGSSEQLDLIVRLDRSVYLQGGDLLNFGSSSTAYDIRVLPNGVQQLQDLGEINMQDPAQITDFLAFALGNYPADHYALIFWDHGAGWTGYGQDYLQRRDVGDFMSPQTMANAVAAALAPTAINKLDLVGYDACLMANVETLIAFEPVAEHFIASEELEPGSGWDYTFLSKLAPTDNAATLASYIIDAFVDGYETPLTLASVDLSLVDNFVSELQTLAPLLVRNDASLDQQLAQARFKSLKMGSDKATKDQIAMVDLGNFLQFLAVQVTDANVIAAISATQMAYDAMITRFDAEPSYRHGTGITIYFPRRTEFYAWQSEYAKIRELAPWRSFLTDYVTPVVSTPAFSVKPTTHFDQSLFTFADELVGHVAGSGDGVVGGLSQVGLLVSRTGGDAYAITSYTFLNSNQMQVSSGSEFTMDDSWDGTVFKLCVHPSLCERVVAGLTFAEDGTTVVLDATVGLVFAKDNDPVSGYFVEKIETGVVEVIFDTSTQTFGVAKFYSYSGSASEYTLKQGDVVIPYVLFADSEGEHYASFDENSAGMLVEDGVSLLTEDLFEVISASATCSYPFLDFYAEDLNGDYWLVDSADYKYCGENAPSPSLAANSSTRLAQMAPASAPTYDLRTLLLPLLFLLLLWY